MILILGICFNVNNNLFMFRKRTQNVSHPISYEGISKSECIRVPGVYQGTPRKDLLQNSNLSQPQIHFCRQPYSLLLLYQSLRNETAGRKDMDYPCLLLQWFLNPWGIWPRLQRCCHPRFRAPAKTWCLHLDINGSWYLTVPKLPYLLRLPRNRNQ